MSDLAAFLEARIAEDEAGATLALGGSVSWPTRALSAAERAAVHRAAERAAPDPARVLAVCAAHRRIVERVAANVDDVYSEWTEDILRALASVYAAHEEFQEEWR